MIVPAPRARRAAVRLSVAATIFALSHVGVAAAQTTGESAAFGASVQLNLVPLLGGGIPITLGEQPSAGGSAPPAYNIGPIDSASLSVSNGLTGQILSTGVVSVSAASSVPDETGAVATATINDLDTQLVGALIAELLTIGATTVQSTASIEGDCGALTASGGAVFEDAQIGGVIGGGQAIPDNPQANLVLLDTLGIRVVVNEQIVTGDGVLTRGLEVNALHISIDVSLLGIGALSGDIVLGHSEAAVECSSVPTPTPTPTGGPVFTPTPTAGGGGTPTPGGGGTPTPGGGGTPTPGGGATPTPGGGGTPTPDGGATPTPGPGATPTPTAQPTPEPPPPPTPTKVPGNPGDDPYTDELGLGGDGFAGATLNPNGVGQLLYGVLYDVRPVAGIGGGLDAQHVNMRITNLNPIGAENGGVLARVRFRDSAASREVYAFDIALSCGEDWAGAVALFGSGADARPAIRSVMPIVTEISDTQVTTGPALDPTNGGAAGVFSLPSGASVEDVRRGYIEVIAMEQLPCEPIEPGGFSRNGNVFSRLAGEDATPPNSLSGEVSLIRAAAGSSFGYGMAAIARFVIAGAGSIQAPVESGLPDVRSCVQWDSGSQQTYTGFASCLAQIDLVLSQARVFPGYDVNPFTAGRTYAVVTLPTRGLHCTGVGVNPPFGCDPTGERVGCRVFDREENELLPSPDCNLPRELSFLEIGGSGVNPRMDARIEVGAFSEGWVLLDFVSNPGGGTGVHERTDLNPNRTTFLGVPASGFRGLPALTLVLQEHTNGNVGGSFGAAVKPPGELEILGLER